MLDALGITGSALTAQSVNLEVIANNVANAATPGYTAKQAVFVPMNPGVAIGAVIDTGQGVDLASQLVDLITAKTAYEAAIGVAKTAEQMTGTLLAAI